MPIPVNNNALFELEVLRARLEIRDFFLKNLFREVYENIAQLLSLVRVLLARPDNRVEEASELVGRSIRDLRDMCRSFYPDTDILKENGFSHGAREVVEIIFPGSKHLVNITNPDEDIKPGFKLIVFNMVLELLNGIRECNGELNDITVSFTRHTIHLVISYKKANFDLNETFHRRAGLLNGKFQLAENGDGNTHLKLLCDLNSNSL